MIVKELVTKCDKCGKPSESVRTYRLRQDGSAWEMDLDAEHAAEVTIAEMMASGRKVDTGSRTSANIARLEGMIRHNPEGAPEPDEDD